MILMKLKSFDEREHPPNNMAITRKTGTRNNQVMTTRNGPSFSADECMGSLRF